MNHGDRMMKVRSFLLALVCSTAPACTTYAADSLQPYLSEDEVIDMMENPQKWDGRTVTIKIYPYDNGFKTSYIVCFEKCDNKYAERSPFVIHTSEDRFKGLMGNRSVIVRATYSSACFYRSTLCPDMRFGQFTEVAPALP